MTNDGRDELLSRAIRLREQGQRDEARTELLTLADRYPDDLEIAYQTAWVHDALGLEAEAVAFYQRALATSGLSIEDRHGAFVGLGSTFRALGRYDEAALTLRTGLDEYPDDAALRAFLAITLYNTGRSRDAVGTLLELLAATSADPGIHRYRRAIEYYADNLDETS